MTGKELRELLVPKAHDAGWRVAWFPQVETRTRGWRVPVAGDAKGWFDLIMLRDRFMFVELKGDGDKIRPEQADWLAAVRLIATPDSKVEAKIWTPADWRDGTIIRALERRGPEDPRTLDTLQLSLASAVLP